MSPFKDLRRRRCLGPLAIWIEKPMRNNPTDRPGVAPNSAAIAPGLAQLRKESLSTEISGAQPLVQDVELHVDPGSQVRGRIHSPSGRLFELELSSDPPGQWLALHVRLAVTDMTDAVWFGMIARGAGPEGAVVRPCLRSGLAEGFVDHFFARHILIAPETRDFMDALHIPSVTDLPLDAHWRELVLFLPVSGVQWHLHDLRLYLA